MTNVMLTRAKLKYEVEDVLYWPELREAAKAYALAYRGDFHFLLEAQRKVRKEERITPGLAKGVLNCMLQDYNNPLKDLPRPGQRRGVIRLRSSFNAAYLWTAKPQLDSMGHPYKAKYHYLDHSRTEGFYIPEGVTARLGHHYFYQEVKGPNYLFMPATFCGQTPRFWEIGDTHPMYYSRCKTCGGKADTMSIEEDDDANDTADVI